MIVQADPIAWQIASGIHDWEDGAYVRRVVRTLAQRGLIGPIEWARVGYDERVVSVPESGDAGDVLEEIITWDDGCAELSLGGAGPHPWSVFVYLNRLNPDTGFPLAANGLDFEIDPAAVEKAGGSAGLKALFRELHSPDDTEVATLHPKTMRDQIMYDEPRFSYLLISPLWLTFLGPGHTRFLDREGLQVSSADVTWLDDEGVFIFMRDPLETLGQEAVEGHRRDLVAGVRSAWIEEA